MISFEGLPIGQITRKTSAEGSRLSFEGLPIGKIIQSQLEGDDWADFLRKTPFKVAGDLADLPANLFQLAEKGVKTVGRGGKTIHDYFSHKPSNIDLEEEAENDYFSPENVDRPSKWLKAAADELGVDITPNPSNAAQRLVGHGIDFAAPAGLLSRFTKGANTLNAIKSAGSVGVGSGALQEAGVNQLGADLASMVAAPYTAAKLNPKNLLNNFKKLPEIPARAANKIFGLSPKSLNVEAASAARDLGIDLPAAALTDSKLTALADQFVGKTPYFGNKLQKKYLNTEAQAKDVLNKIYEEVGPKQSNKLRAEINQLYEHHKTLLPSDARELPTNLVESANKIKSGAAAKDDDLKRLLGYKKDVINQFNPPPSKKFGSLITPHGEIKGLPIPDTLVQNLIDQKKTFNRILWNKGEPRKISEHFRDAVDSMRIGANKDIAKYGEKNPEWYKGFQEADNLYEKAAKRKTLEKSLGKSTNAATGDLSYNALSKAINSPERNALIKKQVDPETFEKIQKLGKVTKALAVKNRNIPNPSGTAVTGAIGALLGSYYKPEAIAAVIGTAALTKLLTDKKIVDLALKYAEKPNLVNSVPLNKRIKKLTGYSALALDRELNRSQKQKEE